MAGTIVLPVHVWRSLILTGIFTICAVMLTAHAQVGDQTLTKVGAWNAYVHLPSDYATSGKSYPAIVFIPGVGEVGTNAAAVLKYGPGYYISKGHKMEFMVDGKLETPIVISLQPDKGWPSALTMNKYIDSVMKRWRIDVDRLYMTGLSMGGWSCDNYISGGEAYAKRPAAIVSMSAPDPDFPLINLRHYAYQGGVWWGFEGTQDYRKMDLTRDSLNNARAGTAKYTKYVGGHCCWNTWYNPEWRENGVSIYEWMLRQKRGLRPVIPNTAPKANAGADQQVKLPTDTSMLYGSGSDAESAISAWKWRQISGPSAAVFAKSTAASGKISGLVAGTYVIELMVTDYASTTAKDTMRITVQSNTVALPNSIPVAIAGVDQLLQSPVASTVLNGSGSYDLDGQITTTIWQQLSGPANCTFTPTNSLQTTVSGLCAGQFSFVLTVADNAGATAKDTVVVRVNTPPVAIAGEDRIVAEGANLQLSASASSDADGTIVSYSWTITNAQTNIVMANKVANPPATLAKGIYNVQLTVTDNHGASASDEIQVTVNAYPVAIAGSDVTLAYPNNSYTIATNASYDPDGQVLNYMWQRISGPGSVMLANVQTATPVFSSMAEGTHTYRLQVTDIYGLSAADTLSIVVMGAAKKSRILIDCGASPTVGQLTVYDKWGKYWNNMTNGREGVQLTNAKDATNNPTTLGIEVLVRLDGTFGLTGWGTNGGNTIGDVGDYPATATNDNIFAHSSTTAGKWRIFGLNPALTYQFKFWGTRSTYGVRTLQIKKSTEAEYTQESNSVMNKDYNNSMVFSGITGVSEIVFDMRVKPGQTFGNISVIDIEAVGSGLATSSVQGFANQNGQMASDEAVVKTAVVSAINQPVQSSKISVWPNPASGLFTLQVAGSYRGNTLVQVVHASGSVIQEQQVQKTQDMLQLPMNTTGLKAGFYFIKVQSGAKVEVVKLMVQ